MKIDVVYNGSHSYYQPCEEKQKQEIRDKYCDGKPYFIFIGTISKRKNLANILLAYTEFRNRHGNNKLDMVIVGGRYGAYPELDKALANNPFLSDIHFVGHVDSGLLSKLLASAQALVYASVFEGFGIPIVEAFYAETAVITSNVTSMPEVAGNAALMVDPMSVESIAHAMSQLANDTTLREELIERGRQRRTLFSWEKTADLLWKSMMRTLETTK